MNPFEVQISNRQNIVGVQENLIRSAVVQSLQSEGVTSAEVSVAILDDSQIRPINREFLGHDRATDSISFRLDETPKLAVDPTTERSTGPYGEQTVLGEVLVSAETADREARAANWPVMHELMLYVIHGTLHLTGHDDQRVEPRRLMRQREREILASLGIEMPREAAVDISTEVNSSERSGAS